MPRFKRRQEPGRFERFGSNHYPAAKAVCSLTKVRVIGGEDGKTPTRRRQQVSQVPAITPIAVVRMSFVMDFNRVGGSDTERVQGSHPIPGGMGETNERPGRRRSRGDLRSGLLLELRREIKRQADRDDVP